MMKATTENGTLRVHGMRSKAKQVQLNRWLKRQLTDWAEVDRQIERAASAIEVGLVCEVEPDGNHRDGLKFVRERELAEHGLSYDPTLNLVQVSSPGEHFDPGFPTTNEHVAQYQPWIARGSHGMVGLFRKLGRDPTFGDGKDTVTEGLLSGAWHVRLPDALRGDPAGERLRADLQRDITPLVGEQLQREFLTACFEDGFGLWEFVDAPDGSIRQLSPINANTLDRWIMDPYERELQRIQCDTGRRRYEVSAQHLLVYSHHRTGANIEGQPNIRAAAPYIEIKQALVRLSALAAEANGLGIKTIEKTDQLATENADEGAQVVQIFDSITAEDNPVIELPYGRTFRWYNPTNGQPNFLPMLEWLDQQIAKPATSSGTLVGFQTYGSKALAMVKDDEKLRSVLYYGILLARLLSQQLLPRIARHKYNWDGRSPLPYVEFARHRESRDPERHSRLVAYVGAKMIQWTEADEERIRAEEGLQPLNDVRHTGLRETVQPPDPRAVGARAYNEAVHGDRDEDVARLSSVHDDANGRRWMLALVPPREFAARVHSEATAYGVQGVDSTSYHVTLVYGGHRPESVEQIGRRVAAAVGEVVAGWRETIDLEVSGAGVFFNDDRCAHLLVGGPGLEHLRAELFAALNRANLLPPQKYGFIPHMTLRYFGEQEEIPPDWINVARADYPAWPVDAVLLVVDDTIVQRFELGSASDD